jgi:enoyl-CoA hydratase/carnithine racemase
LFTAGFGLKWISHEGAEAHGPDGFAGLGALSRIAKPVIAAVNGLVGGGFEIVLLCHLTIPAENVEFPLPELPFDAIPGSRRAVLLLRQMPRALALQRLLTWQRLDSAAALRYDMVNKVVPRSKLISAVRQSADAILLAASLAVSAPLEFLNFSAGLTAGEVSAELRGLPDHQRMLDSHGRREGAVAFAEKRAPLWLEN